MAPHAVAWGADHLDLFVLGTDLAIYHKRLSGESWSDWGRIGERMTSPPYAVARRPGVLEVVAIGEDLVLKKRTWRNGQWKKQWESLCATITASPCAVARRSGHLDTFFRGEERAIYHQSSDRQTARQTAEPHSLEGTATRAPCAVCWPDDRLDVFVVGEDSAVWNRTKTKNDDEWLEWTSLGGQAFSPVSAILCNDTELELFILGRDSDIWSRRLHRGLFRSPLSAPHHRRSQACGTGVLNNPHR